VTGVQTCALPILGALYEDLGEVEKAKEQYRLAVHGSEAIAFNNLARLYNLEKKYTEAFGLLWLGLQQSEVTEQLKNDSKLQIAWYKNLGWARYGQKRYSEAEAQLTLAITLASNLEKSQPGTSSEQTSQHDQVSTTHDASEAAVSLSAAYCLRAQVYTALKKTSKIDSDWDACLQNANPSLPELDQWATLAQTYQQSQKSQSKPDVDSTKPQGEKR